MFEAGAPLPYVMDQVGRADSTTTLEIYAQAQKRVSRKNVHAAFDRLLIGAYSDVVRSPSEPPAASLRSWSTIGEIVVAWVLGHPRLERGDHLAGRGSG